MRYAKITLEVVDDDRHFVTTRQSVVDEDDDAKCASIEDAIETSLYWALHDSNAHIPGGAGGVVLSLLDHVKDEFTLLENFGDPVFSTQNQRVRHPQPQP